LSRQNLQYRALAIMLAALLLHGRAQAQTEEEWDWCYGIGVPAPNVQPPEILISGCTAVIQSGIHGGRNLVVALTNRGVGYRQTSQYDRAFADFEQAIARDPDYMPAYDQRGSLYWHVADFDHARQDLDQIVRLKRREVDLSAAEVSLEPQ
jgi:tetratricopeptide (TPR) repeat protein